MEIKGTEGGNKIRVKEEKRNKVNNEGIEKRNRKERNEGK